MALLRGREQDGAPSPRFAKETGRRGGEEKGNDFKKKENKEGKDIITDFGLQTSRSARWTIKDRRKGGGDRKSKRSSRKKRRSYVRWKKRMGGGELKKARDTFMGPRRKRGGFRRPRRVPPKEPRQKEEWKGKTKFWRGGN